jgi:transcriptional regulator with XRE-family HTH domain
LNTNVGHLIRACRDRIGLTQAELADRIPLSQKQVSRIERGHYVQVPRSTVIRIAEILHEPLVTGEVNLWLALLGFAPLIRPGLPLPRGLREAVLAADPVPAWCIDPSGQLVLANRTGSTLAGNSDRFNVIHWLLGDPTELEPAVRRRLLHRLFYWVTSAGPEAWLAEWAEELPAAVRESWQSLVQDRSDSGVTSPWWQPLMVARDREPPLLFHVGIVYPVPRPDLMVASFQPADARTREWCLSVGAEAKPSSRIQESLG